MKNNFALFLALLSFLPVCTVAQEQNNGDLIPITSSNSVGYESISAYVLKNSIKQQSPKDTTFKVLLTGVSTTETIINKDLTPVSSESRIDEYALDDSRVILNVNMDCRTKKTTVLKILSFDQTTGRLKEQLNENNEQDPEMNNALYDVVCK